MENKEQFEFDLAKMKELMTSIAIHSKQVVDHAFSEADNHELYAAMYLNLALSDMAILKSIYYSNVNNHRDDIDHALEHFPVFAQEVTTDFSTQHSVQWVDIEFREFIGRVQNCPLALSHGTEEYVLKEE